MGKLKPDIWKTKNWDIFSHNIETGIMVGLGEEKDEIAELLQDAGLGVVVFR